MQKELLSILRKEVNPALGCTGPTSVSFAVSVAKDAVGGEVQSVKVLMDKDGYKNSVSVGIPGTDLFGLDIAAALGAMGDSKAGLEVLKNITPVEEEKAKKLLPETVVDIKWDLEDVGLYNEAWVTSDKGTGHAIVRKTHTNTVLIELNDKKVFEDIEGLNPGPIDYSKDAIRSYSIKDLYDFASNEPIENLDFLKDAVPMNLALAEAGMKEPVGSGFGYAYKDLTGQNMVLKAKAVTAAAADARMAGVNLPAMSCATSGNVGIAASLPLSVLAEDLGKNNEDLSRALALSFLTVIYLKSHIGRLSPMCACAIASSLGVAAGAVMLQDGDISRVGKAIDSVVGSLGGILCDGAKYGCALKLANAIGVALEAASFAMQYVSIKARDGLVGRNVDETIAGVGKIATQGMAKADEVMARVIIDRERIVK